MTWQWQVVVMTRDVTLGSRGGGVTWQLVVVVTSDGVTWQLRVADLSRDCGVQPRAITLAPGTKITANKPAWLSCKALGIDWTKQTALPACCFTSLYYPASCSAIGKKIDITLISLKFHSLFMLFSMIYLNCYFKHTVFVFFSYSASEKMSTRVVKNK